MEATLKGIYEMDKSAGAAATLAVNAGDVKLSASMRTYIHNPNLTRLALAVEKPDSFILHYNVPKKDFRFKFMNTVKVVEKPLNLTYEHKRRKNSTVLDGTFEFFPANKVSVNYAFGSKICKLKYIYTYKGLITLEPTYDVSKNAWNFGISSKICGNDTFKASYETSDKVLGIEWAWDSERTGPCKIAASVKLSEELKALKLSAETTWNLEM